MFKSKRQAYELRISNLEFENDCLKAKLAHCEDMKDNYLKEAIDLKTKLNNIELKKPKCELGDWCSGCMFSIMIRDRCGKPIYFCNKDNSCDNFVPKT